MQTEIIDLNFESNLISELELESRNHSFCMQQFISHRRSDSGDELDGQVVVSAKQMHGRPYSFEGPAEEA